MQSGSQQGLGRQALQHEHDLKQRRVLQAAGGLQGVDQLLERQGLMGKAGQHSVSQLSQ